jgi:hypothetical protein
MSVPVGQFFQLLRNFEEGLNRAANGSTKNIDVRSAYVPTANADMVMAGNDLDIATEIGRTIIKGRLRSRPMLECKLTKAGYDLLEFRRPMTIREVSQSLKMHGVAPLSYLHADWEWVGRLDMHILDLSEEHDEKYYGYIQGGVEKCVPVMSSARAFAM